MLEELYEQIAMPLFDLLTVFDDNNVQNQRIDQSIKLAKYAANNDLPLSQVSLQNTRLVSQEDEEELNSFSIPLPSSFKNWVISSENFFTPYVETVLFLVNMIPVLLMCNLLAKTVYPEYDEISTEILCYNKSFEGFQVLWVDNGSAPITKVLDFSKYGY